MRDADALGAALAALGDVAPDVLAVQELDVGAERSGGVHQPSVVARALAAAGGDVDWRFAPTVLGVPGSGAEQLPVAGRLEDPRWPEDDRPRYGTALLVRRPVRRWSALPLRAGGLPLPLPVRHPTTDRPGLLVVQDEPRVAVAAELDGVTVVAAHLSFAPPVGLRQLRAVRAWAASLPGPVLLVGDLNLPGSLPARVLRARALVTRPTYPLPEPTRQLDHVLALPPAGDRRDHPLLPWRTDEVDLALGVGDHRPLCVDLEVPARG
ncbi:endonuclease/exonuclease/phosphatase family protein [Pseudokineococcus marinus]|uniref:Endonuclease n=1 Tax=Pseudokineococcus marinus TaxID=351215 RepID=A0A849BYM6_9ACTN|nr:endonuclease/exonuclease/phosphatase family protein [Pseudokineococcus marinus]NNH24516.1 endonuclease [Pseudokineococcus marinus]